MATAVFTSDWLSPADLARLTQQALADTKIVTTEALSAQTERGRIERVVQAALASFAVTVERCRFLERRIDEQERRIQELESKPTLCRRFRGWHPVFARRVRHVQWIALVLLAIDHLQARQFVLLVIGGQAGSYCGDAYRDASRHIAVAALVPHVRRLALLYDLPTERPS
jgi:hypothetical protein